LYTNLILFCFDITMEIKTQNYNNRCDFGCMQLEKINLRKSLLNGKFKLVQAELCSLNTADLPMLESLYKSYLPGKAPKYLANICDNLKKVCNSEILQKSKNKIFFMVKQNGIIRAVCHAVSRPGDLKLKYISNFCQNDGVKGAGTSLIVALVELARKTEKPVIKLNSVREALDFYDKLGFEMINDQQDFIMKQDYYETFLESFKTKYFSK